jgi:hypothetical protein
LYITADILITDWLKALKLDADAAHLGFGRRHILRVQHSGYQKAGKEPQ